MFVDRRDAGRQLGAALVGLKSERPIVYGLPRGGVPVAFEVASDLDAPLDVLLVRKIGVPGQSELALGAMALGPEPAVTWNAAIVAELGIGHRECDRLAREQALALQRRRDLYRGHLPDLSPNERTVIVVDDGLATGATARAALAALRKAGARRVVLAVPVAPAETVEVLCKEADDVVVLETPGMFPGVGAFYLNFDQTSDDEVVGFLDRRRRQTHADHTPPAQPT